MAQDFQDQECYIEFERLKNAISQFQCPICLNLAHKPRECIDCGGLFGQKCLQEWHSKNRDCPKCRSKMKNFRPMHGALVYVYNDLDIKCKYLDCNHYVKYDQLHKHEENCQRSKCVNYDICQELAKSKFIQMSVCSLECLLLTKIKKNEGNFKQILKQINKYKDSFLDHENFQQIKSKYQEKIQVSNLLIDSQSNKGYPLESLIQVRRDKSSRQQCSSSKRLKKLLISNSFSRYDGVHFWEFEAKSTNFHHMKLGVTTSIPQQFNVSFCDFEDGFAYYGIGQLRNGSKGHGVSYGDKYLKEGMLAVYLDMNKGILAFGKNDICWGLAFQNQALTKGPIRIAASLLIQSGCAIKIKKEIPAQFLNLSKD